MDFSVAWIWGQWEGIFWLLAMEDDVIASEFFFKSLSVFGRALIFIVCTFNAILLFALEIVKKICNNGFSPDQSRHFGLVLKVYFNTNPKCLLWSGEKQTFWISVESIFQYSDLNQNQSEFRWSHCSRVLDILFLCISVWYARSLGSFSRFLSSNEYLDTQDSI